jgi:hypothetical protein
MNRIVPFSTIVGALAFLVAPASAQMTPSKSATHASAAQMQAMMPACSGMMKEVMTDPVVQKRMMAIMQKHTMQHSGQGSMMMKQVMADPVVQKRMMAIMQKHMMQQSGQGSMMMMPAMQSGSSGSDFSAHAAHHSAEPEAMPTAAAVPSPTPSP